MKTSHQITIFVLLLQGVGCIAWNITLPYIIEALNGSCVIINCTFLINSTYNNDLTNTSRGAWYKNKHEKSEYVVFNSSISYSAFKGNITGKLEDKNCTTIFYDVGVSHNATYFFRIIGNNGLQWTFTNKNVSIHVIGSPPSPTVKMFMGQMEVQEVLEGSTVNLRCSSKTLCSSSPPTLTWSSTDRLILNDNSRPQQQQQTETEIISNLNFTATHLQHGVTYSCNITYQLHNRNTTAQNNITLYVLYAPKNTSVSVFPSNSVLEGTSVTLKCRSDANPAVLNYTWYRENRGQLEQIHTGLNLTFNTINRTHTGHYYCLATNKHGTQNASVLLDIQYAPTISHSSCNKAECECVCDVHGNPFPKVEWHRAGRLFSKSINIFISEKQLNSTNLRSIITFSSSTDDLDCVGINKYGNTSELIHLDPCIQKKSFNLFFVLVGVAVGVLVIIILCAITCVCTRRGNRMPCQNKQGGTTKTISTSEEKKEEEFVHANKAVLSSAGADTPNQPESLLYSSVTFTKTKTEPVEISVSSFDTEYAEVKHSSARVTQCSTDVNAKQEKNCKTAEEPADSQLYAQVKRRNLPGPNT